jgi:hypothetical protein
MWVLRSAHPGRPRVGKIQNRSGGVSYVLHRDGPPQKRRYPLDLDQVPLHRTSGSSRRDPNLHGEQRICGREGRRLKIAALPPSIDGMPGEQPRDLSIVAEAEIRDCLLTLLSLSAGALPRAIVECPLSSPCAADLGHAVETMLSPSLNPAITPGNLVDRKAHDAPDRYTWHRKLSHAEATLWTDRAVRSHHPTALCVVPHATN